MGIFSSFFKGKPKITVNTEIGEFKLVYSKKNKNLWTNTNSSISKTVRGTNLSPDPNHINFLKESKREIEKLNKEITKKFRKEFTNAELPSNFSTWKDKFNIVALDIMMIHNGDVYWNITFEDLEEPYYHFTLFIEGDRIGPDFSIDN